MNSVLALWKREYLEHRGAFLYAPMIIIGILVLAFVLGVSFGRFHIPLRANLLAPADGFEMVFLVLVGMWFGYLLLMLFFYFADAFSADRRNNAMFFWKSMPQSDLKILANKFFTGTIVFPAMILIAVLTTGVLLILFVGVIAGIEPQFGSPDYPLMVWSLFQIGLVAVTYFGLAMLWYAPFLAWVGGLSTVFGRWSIPLAFVIPIVLMLLENVLFFGEGPRGGRVYAYLAERLNYGFEWPQLQVALFTDGPVDAGAMIGQHLASIDWTAMGIGLVFAAAVVYAASEYRRRIIGN